MAKWVYNFRPTENSLEALTQSKLIKGLDWA
jgi:hypothetical protein